MKTKILTFGEIIWDIYDTRHLIGGAGLNFAAHCSKCGADSYLLSAVGRDDLGNKALSILSDFHISTDYIKYADKPTGQCIVTLNQEGVPDFHVLKDTAYDNIVVSKEDITNFDNAAFDALYFGTLIQRSPVSRTSLRKLCQECTFKEIICDVNLRKDCYDVDSAKFCLEHATILKISQEEEPLLRALNLYCVASDSLEDLAAGIYARYPQLKYLIITLGEEGAFVFCTQSRKSFVQRAKKVSVVSTVGAGDSFIAAWITSYLSGSSAELCTKKATELSGYVVSKADAIPDYTYNDGMISY